MMPDLTGIWNQRGLDGCLLQDVLKRIVVFFSKMYLVWFTLLALGYVLSPRKYSSSGGTTIQCGADLK
jgi:hypothetical protein